MAQSVLEVAAPRAGAAAPAVRRWARHVDYVLVAAVLAMSAIGVVMVYSATRVQLRLLGGHPTTVMFHQAIFVGIGIVGMVIAAAIDYHHYEELGIVAYVGVVLALLAVMSPLGSSALGSQRWFALGPIQVQPSAFAILAVIMAAATYIARTEGEITLRRLVVLLAMGGVPMLLIAVQPDLGTAITVGCVLGGMIVIGGTPFRYIAGLLIIGVLGIVGALHFGILQPYQLKRLTSFMSQGSGPNATYNLAQSKIAIGSGGLFGTGMFKGSETNLGYVPSQATDFIFTTVGEQLGFVGSAVVVALFSVIVWRIWSTARMARDQLGTMLCSGVLVLMAFSVFENIGMTTGIMPITGIPLPFMTYGGSATLAFFLSIGIVLSVALRRFQR
ncbi:MAG: FtsW/RodA/SpoVE family cell cycle protein [Acidimicrobiales bacterium]